MTACMLEEGAADAHMLGGGKVYQPEAVVISQLVDAEASIVGLYASSCPT